MKIIDEIIIRQSKRVNGALRSFLAKAYLFFIRIKNKIKYGDGRIFNQINIELGRRCNRKCSYCPKSKFPEKNDERKMSFKIFKKIVRELENINYSEKVCFSGYYEPLLDDDIVRHVRYVRKKLKKAKIIIYTNGDMLTEKLYKRLKENDVLLAVSLHGENVNKKYQKIKKMTGGKNTVIKKKITERILSTRGGLLEVENKEVKTSCIFPSLQLTVDVDGNVILCFDDYFSENKFGNVKEKNLLKIWRDESFKNVKKDLLSGKPEREICKHCFRID